MKSDFTILSIWQSNFRTKKTEQLLAASLRLCLKNLGVKWVDTINYIKNYMTALIYNLPQIENFLFAFPHTHTDRHWRHRQHVACGSFEKKRKCFILKLSQLARLCRKTRQPLSNPYQHMRQRDNANRQPQ